MSLYINNPVIEKCDFSTEGCAIRFITLDNKKLYNVLLSIRSHGWGRDLDIKERKRLEKKSNTSYTN